MFYRAETSPRCARSAEETQASRRRRRIHTPSQDNQGSRSQADLRCYYCSHSRRVPTTQQDSVLARVARRGERGGPVCYLWSVRRIPGSQIGTRPKGNCFRRVPGRGWSNQREGGYVWHAHGRTGQADSRHLPAPVVVGVLHPTKYPSLVLFGVRKVAS